jgi:small ligand-binding sensory domain FIST
MMEPAEAFRTAIATDSDARAAAEKVAADLAAQGGGGTLGFVYVTDRIESDMAAVADTLRAGTRVERWVGTVGLGVIAGRQASFNEPAVAAMIVPWPERAIQLYDGVGGKPFASDTLGMATAIVHADPRNRQFDGLLESLASASEAYLLGGVTASRTRLFDRMAGAQAKEGVSGLFLSWEIPVAIGVSQGCSPIGPIRTVTDIHDGLVAALDGQPALSALLGDLKVGEGGDLRAAIRPCTSACRFPTATPATTWCATSRASTRAGARSRSPTAWSRDRSCSPASATARPRPATSPPW